MLPGPLWFCSSSASFAETENRHLDDCQRVQVAHSVWCALDIPLLGCELCKQAVVLIELFGSLVEIPLVRVFSVKSLTRIKLLIASMSCRGCLCLAHLGLWSVGGSFLEV